MLPTSTSEHRPSHRSASHTRFAVAPLEVTIQSLHLDPLLRSTLTVLAATAIAVACLPKEDDTRDEGSDSWGSYSYYYASSGQRSAGFGPEDVTVALTSHGLTLHVVDAPDTMNFGFAQTGDCAAGACWQGESCTSSAVGPALCHEVTNETLRLTLVSAADHVIPSVTTRVAYHQVGVLTFMLDTGEACFTWGHSPEYYADAFGCTVW